MVLGIEFEQHFEHCGRHLPIADQEVVDRRAVDHLQCCLRVVVLPLEDHLARVGNQLFEALHSVVAGVAGGLDVALLLLAARACENLDKIPISIRRIGYQTKGLVGSRSKLWAYHCVVSRL